MPKGSSVASLTSVAELAQDWYRHLRAANLAPSTVGSYRKAVNALTDVVGEDTDIHKVTHRVLRRFFADLSEQDSKRRPGQKISASYVSLVYRGLQQFFKWLTEVEKEIEENPFTKLSPPAIPEKPVPVLSDEDLKSLLSACCGSAFEDRRDTAVIRVLLDTGVRVSELAGLTLDDLDFVAGTITVLGKGRRLRHVPFGNKTGEALRRYLRTRAKHSRSGEPALWLGKQGPMGHFGIRQILERRGNEAGVKHCNPHRFRHTFAHRWLAEGHQETDLMRITGWRSRSMVSRYAASAADERARDAHHRAALGDRI